MDESVPLRHSMSSPRRSDDRRSASSGSSTATIGFGRGGSYPLSCALTFCPGGITYATPDGTDDMDAVTSRREPKNNEPTSCAPGIFIPQATLQEQTNLIRSAKQADDALRWYSLWYQMQGDTSAAPPPPVHVVPSLSVLAESVWGRLTGCTADQVKGWADAMVLGHYTALLQETPEWIPSSWDDVAHRVTARVDEPSHGFTSVSQLLKHLLNESEAAAAANVTTETSNVHRRVRPCGYVFKRGDIAWNCRTCQTDQTCVICDECFRGSNHEGHEVYFHRTTPGGCCDCGDAEAWHVTGCCDVHRPVVAEPVCRPATHRTATNGGASGGSSTILLDDPMEAVYMAATARQWAVETVSGTDPATALPPRLLAVLGAVIGAAVHCILDAVDGAAVGADAIQWNKRWSDEAARIANQTPHVEDYYNYYQQRNSASSSAVMAPPLVETTVLPPATVQTFLVSNKTFPDQYRLHLRLHNDDVHTFDEVIDALHEPRQALRRPNEAEPQHPSLVSLRENATEMTHHVDADGQVTVKTYSNVASAMRGFRRLKSCGLHCAVVSTVQVDAEHRARAACAWLTDVAAAHPAAQALLVHALVQLPGRNNPTDEDDLAGVSTWHPARMMPPWAGCRATSDPVAACRQRFDAFPPHLVSSYVTREEAELLHGMALLSLHAISSGVENFVSVTGTTLDFYSFVPYRLPSARYHKSPQALWGTLPSLYADSLPAQSKHPLLERLMSGSAHTNPLALNRLTESVSVVDTDLRKQQEGERFTISVFPHKLPGLNMISGIGTTRVKELDARRPPLPSPMDLRHLLATSSFRAPLSPVLLLLLLDPYPTKQVRGAIHALFLSLLTNPRFKSRFAGAMAIAYRPLTTLFCAGIGTDADTPLHFTVQIFTAGSLVRALGHGPATEKLLLSDHAMNVAPLNASTDGDHQVSIGVFLPPIAHVIVRCIHTNLLGETKEVKMILKNMSSADDENSQDEYQGNAVLLPALTYVAGEHPLMTPLPTAPDDGFLDSRSTRHKRLPHLLRDLDYVIETPGTAVRLLRPTQFPVYQGPSLSFRGEDVLSFSTVFARMLRLAQGMDPQKRKISGGHVEFEQNRWLEAFGLSLNFGGTRDALAECPCGISAAVSAGDAVSMPEDSFHLHVARESVGNIVASLLREVKLWLYREGLLETGLPIPSGGINGAMDLAQVEALQRSTLHVSSSQYDNESSSFSDVLHGTSSSVALSCATGVKMTETQLTLIENALKVEAAQRLEQRSLFHTGKVIAQLPSTGPGIGDWLRVPHSPLAGDSLSFHLPLHRALAKCIRCICSVVVPESVIASNSSWWKIPVLDDSQVVDTGSLPNHPLVPLIKSTLRSSNCRVVWSSGPDCTPQEAQRRRSRARTVSANIAVAKVVHSLADHPIRCLAAAQQIERHLWARNGTSVAGMAMNYSSAPLCRSFRDLDLLLVQLSASGMSCGLGARRVFSLLLSRFSLDGYLCDPERRSQAGIASQSSFGSVMSIWVNPPRLQDADHATILAESFFSTLCVLVTELPLLPPTSVKDDTSLRLSIRRELLHALAAEPRSHSEAMTAAAVGISRREESEGTLGKGGSGGLFRSAFSSVLGEIGKQKVQTSSRASSGPPAYELKAEFCDEYDPTFFHLRRPEHQHAMDVIVRLRKTKWGPNEEALETHCLPITCTPPKAHPRFLPCRLLLHLDSMDAALRRALLFAITNGSWIPPPEPRQRSILDEDSMDTSTVPTDNNGITLSVSSAPGSSDVPVTTFNRRLYQAQSSSGSFAQRHGMNDRVPFSGEVVASSSVSLLEVLQLLTLQVHTLEECASLHRLCPDLDDEGRSLSSGLSINSYLGRLVFVPTSLTDVWAFRSFPDGPLKSKGSGERKGSILGQLIILYEHRADHGTSLDTDDGDTGKGEDDHGGARALTTSGLKWLLRFINSLVDGASSVGAATKSATTGVPVRSQPLFTQSGGESGSGAWTISEDVRSTICGMLDNLPDLWPKLVKETTSPEKGSAKNKEARKAAQQRVMDMMKRKQAAFAATIAPTDAPAGGTNDDVDQETDLCIICRCDDTDGESNGPLGYLGHVQRSRMVQMRSMAECFDRDKGKQTLVNTYRVIGHMGCQLRETEAMDSRPLVCLPKGSIVSVLQSKISTQYDILSRRILVRHVSKDPETKAETTAEGWASVQSSQGYVILSPLVAMCYNNARWGCTRPIVKQCGHAAHLKCVETHTLSLHQRAAGEQPYDGRFAANISDGEFLCPLCKQLSNILIPRDRLPTTTTTTATASSQVGSPNPSQKRSSSRWRDLLVHPRTTSFSATEKRALADFGFQLHSAMCVNWERATGTQKNIQEKWHPAIQKWDYEENDLTQSQEFNVKNLMRLLRQQLIAWAAFGHSAAALEAASRGVEEVLPFGVVSSTSDPWLEYREDTNAHPMLLELKRTLTGCSGLLEVLYVEMSHILTGRDMSRDEGTLIGSCLSDILEGSSWMLKMPPGSRTKEEEHSVALWTELTALISAIPSHTSSDGSIALRSEARATAAAMWAVKGMPCDSASRTEPPAPLAIRQLFASGNQGHPTILSNWGTMYPFVNNVDSNSIGVPFRPGVACGFLYFPFLAWDLCTLTGAILSCMLTNSDHELPDSSDLLRLAHTLLIGRIVQAITTPHGFEIPDEMDVEVEECWTEVEAVAQGAALVDLLAHCRKMVESKCVDLQNEVLGRGSITDVPSLALLAGIGRAILPFCRALVLMLRASVAAIRERQGKSNVEKSDADKLLDGALCHRDTMTTEDGFYFLNALQCPKPTDLIHGDWFTLINRWLISAIGLEIHHWSVGRSMVQSVMEVPAGNVTAAQQHADMEYGPVVAVPLQSADNADDAMHLDDADDQILTIRNREEAFRLLGDFDDSDEELADSMDEAEEMVGLDTLQSLGSNTMDGQIDAGESSDASSATPNDVPELDSMFANVSLSPILPFQPTLLGTIGVGPGRSRSLFEFSNANEVMADMSHLGLIHQKEIPTFSLIRLPKSFVELYNIVNKVKGRDDAAALDDADDASSSETSICLLTGAVMRSGSSRRLFARAARPPGACTLHARKTASGIGIFFLVQKCTVLLMHNNKSAYSPSLFVDEHGEEDPQLRRGRPLFLNEARYRALELLWRQQGIPREVAQIRSTSDRVIRDNWY